MQSVVVKPPQVPPSKRPNENRAARPHVEQLTLMLTEVCNLDCWMCDFRKSTGLTKKLPLAVDEILNLLRHPLWKSSLRKITLTGGEPFAHPEIGALFDALRYNLGDLHINLSTNATLLKRMLPVLERHRGWRKLTLLVSVDGIAAHDTQRGEPGLFRKTVQNLDTLRKRFPDIPILIKFTVTPVNYRELYQTFEYFIGKGYVITAKMVENNPNYTNKLSHQSIESRFAFSDEMIADIRAQLQRVLAMLKKAKRNQRYYTFQVRELIESLEPAWTRSTSCLTPTQGVFIDTDLNLFTCKEYGPVLNLGEQALESLPDSQQFHHIFDNERCNAGQCTRCTSQMQIRAKGRGWLSFLPFLTR